MTPFKNPVEGWLRLTADGRWLLKDEPITHPGLITILESNYGRGPDGRYEVRLGPQRVVVEIEDAPYLVRDVAAMKDGSLSLRLNDGSYEKLNPRAVELGENGHAYVAVKDGEPARFDRKAELRLGEFLDERDGRLGLLLNDQWYAIKHRST